MARPTVPPPSDDDHEDVAWALRAASAQWRREDHADAISWVKRAAETAEEVGHATRARELFQVAVHLAGGPPPRASGPPALPAASSPASSGPPPRSGPPPAPSAQSPFSPPPLPMAQLGSPSSFPGAVATAPPMRAAAIAPPPPSLAAPDSEPVEI